MGLQVPDRDKQAKALVKMFEGMEKILMNKESHKLPSWDRIRGHNIANSGGVQDFVMRFHIQLASW
jgi:hypothetical protein